MRFNDRTLFSHPALLSLDKEFAAVMVPGRESSANSLFFIDESLADARAPARRPGIMKKKWGAGLSYLITDDLIQYETFNHPAGGTREL